MHLLNRLLSGQSPIVIQSDHGSTTFQLHNCLELERTCAHSRTDGKVVSLRAFWLFNSRKINYLMLFEITSKYLFTMTIQK